MANGVFNNHRKDGRAKHCGHECGLRWAGNDKGIGANSEEGWPGWYRSYNAMKQRCLDAKSTSFANYGGRGIRICDRWLKDPLTFYEDMGDRPEGQTIDRIDVNGNYEPGNCRWADAETQRANQRCNLQERNY